MFVILWANEHGAAEESTMWVAMTNLKNSLGLSIDISINSINTYSYIKKTASMRQQHPSTASIGMLASMIAFHAIHTRSSNSNSIHCNPCRLHSCMDYVLVTAMETYSNWKNKFRAASPAHDTRLQFMNCRHHNIDRALFDWQTIIMHLCAIIDELSCTLKMNIDEYTYVYMSIQTLLTQLCCCCCCCCWITNIFHTGIEPRIEFTYRNPSFSQLWKLNVDASRSLNRCWSFSWS